MAFHKDEAGSSLHALHAFTFATAVERVAGTGYTITAADIGKVAKQTDTNRYYLLVNNSPLTWSEVTAPGGSGGINYISNDGAEDSAASWNTYADAAAAAPVDGTGGTANITITRTTSNPLRSNASFLITKDAANRQGQGVSFDFTIDRADEAKPLSIEMDYEPLSGFVAGSDSTNSDLVAYIYDLDYSVMIQPTPFKIVGGVGNKHKFLSTFQSSAASGGANSRKYRLILHIATTNASAWTFKFDGVRVGPQVLNYGSPVTDWQSFTPTGSWVTNSTYTGKFRRIGDSMELLVNIALSGAPTATSLFINLPSGYSIDTSKLNTTSNNATPFGEAKVIDTGSTEYSAVVRWRDSTSVALYALAASGSFANENNVTQAIPFTLGNTDSVEARFTVPILGWSSTVEMSNDASTRIVFAEVYRTVAQASQAFTASSDQKVQLIGINNDTHAAYSTSNFRYVIPTAGFYEFRPNLVLSNTPTNGIASLKLYKNGVSFKTANTYITTAGNTGISPTFTDNCIAGDYYELYLNPTVAVDVLSAATVTGGSTFSVARISGPAQIAASELVAAKYYRSTNQTGIGSPEATIAYDAVIFDTHGAVNTSNGRFTAPVAGIYNFIVSFYAGISNDGQRKSLRYRVNGAGSEPYFAQVASIGAGSADRGVGSFNVKLGAGDYVEIRFESTANVDINGGIINNVVDVYKLR